MAISTIADLKTYIEGKHFRIVPIERQDEYVEYVILANSVRVFVNSIVNVEYSNQNILIGLLCNTINRYLTISEDQVFFGNGSKIYYALDIVGTEGVLTYHKYNLNSQRYKNYDEIDTFNTTLIVDDVAKYFDTHNTIECVGCTFTKVNLEYDYNGYVKESQNKHGDILGVYTDGSIQNIYSESDYVEYGDKLQVGFENYFANKSMSYGTGLHLQNNINRYYKPDTNVNLISGASQPTTLTENIHNRVSADSFTYLTSIQVNSVIESFDDMQKFIFETLITTPYSDYYKIFATYYLKDLIKLVPELNGFDVRFSYCIDLYDENKNRLTDADNYVDRAFDYDNEDLSDLFYSYGSRLRDGDDVFTFLYLFCFLNLKPYNAKYIVIRNPFNIGVNGYEL